MTNFLMDKKCRDLILAAEITGLLHDLGKLHPEFAEEKSRGGKSRIKPVENAIQTDAHGAILEEDRRAYPETVPEDSSKPQQPSAFGGTLAPLRYLSNKLKSGKAKDKSPKDWLQQIKKHENWAKVLKLPQDWIKPKTVQAGGLGDPLRQHHANKKFPEQELTLLGDVYTVGADWRDSALDKGSGNTQSGEQRLGVAYIADSFGNELTEKEYSPAVLENLWYEAKKIIENTLLTPEAPKDIPNTRQQFLTQIEPIFRQALGETRRPTNDVTLWHHSFSVASLFKAAAAEGVLRQDFSYLQDEEGLLDFAKLGRIRFRLLGIRWDWTKLTQGALKPVVFTALTVHRNEAVVQLRILLERDNPIGNIIYEDDDGVVLAVPGFYEGLADKEGEQSELLFRQSIVEPLRKKMLNALADLGVGTPVRLVWTEPRLYLTDYTEVIARKKSQSQRELVLQVGETELQGLWAKQFKGQVEICSQCGLRPSQARELSINESGLSTKEVCDFCRDLLGEDEDDQDQYTQSKKPPNPYIGRKKQAQEYFGWAPKTFNLQKIRKQRNDNPDNARVVLLSVRIDAQQIVNGAALVTQVARPFNDLNPKSFNVSADKRPKAFSEVGQLFQQILTHLQKEKSEEALKSAINKKTTNDVRVYLGDDYWLDFWKKSHDKDGRVEGNANEKALSIVKEFFLREFVPDGLSRHEGDCLALFGMRKHASPGRLARIWDDLHQLWKDILKEIGNTMNGYAAPLSLDAQGFRVIVAAEDARKVLNRIHDTIQKRLGKVRAGFNPHVSALVFNEKFPLYVAFDAMRRMERRIADLPPQEWQLLKEPLKENNSLHLTWNTPRGQIAWKVNLQTSDPEQEDLWYPHVICTSRPEGPGRIVHVTDLKEADTIQLRPATFDFAVLEGTARRYQLAYDMNNEGRRYHFILGESGRPPYLLEQIPEILDLVPVTLKAWDSTRRKMIFGQVVEYYGKWVRDVPKILQKEGREAWHTHVEAIFSRYLPGKENEHIRQELLGMLDDGRFFDAFEWADFVEKSAAVD